MVSVIVTGGAGFIGTHLVRALAERGEQVLAVDQRTPPADCPADHRRLDLADPGAWAELGRLMVRARAVFHLAAAPGVRSAHPDIARLRRRDNVEASRLLLARVPPEVAVIVTSSSSVYGRARRRADGSLRPSREDDPLRPRGGYARSKAAVEGLCARRAARGGRVAVARPFTVVGEGQRPDMAVARWLEAAERGRPLRIFGSADRVRDVTDVRQVVRGLLAVADRGVEGVVNLGTGRPVRLGRLAEAVGAVVGRPARVVVEPARPEEAPATLADTDRCRRLLGFVPVTDLEEVVARQAADRLAPLPAGMP